MWRMLYDIQQSDAFDIFGAARYMDFFIDLTDDSVFRGFVSF